MSSAAPQTPLTPQSVGAGAAPFPSEVWQELLALCQDEAAGDRAMLERLIERWRASQGASWAALYLERDGRLQLDLVAAAAEPAATAGAVAAPPGHGQNGHRPAGVPLPEVLEDAASSSEMGVLRFPGGSLVFSPAPPDPARLTAAAAAFPAPPTPPDSPTPAPPRTPAPPHNTSQLDLGGPLPLLLASSLKVLRLRQELKEQQFQVNYRVVELESLYDVGLAVAATLDLEKLSEEILLRAVSLLDARRGALYILEGDSYRLERTFGGDAAASFASDNTELRAFLADAGEAPADLLPGARYLTGVPIEIDGGPRGLLAAGDKESRRRGVGPFPASDRRTLGLFANQAAIALENARLHLQALEKERLEREMHLAADIQRRILPRGAPPIPGYELVGWNRPARQIGGDYYDLFKRQDGHLGLVVGDVSGKGMPAALMVSTLHSALHLLLDQAGFGPELFERLNRHVLESSAANKFITLVLADLDPESGCLNYLNAGHNPALLLRHPHGAADPAAPAPLTPLTPLNDVEELGSTGLPIGVLPGSRFQARTVTLHPGDLLCIYTDGITEAEAPDDEEFGMARLIALLREYRDRPLAEALEALQAATGRFAAGQPQYDDQTVVILRRNLN